MTVAVKPQAQNGGTPKPRRRPGRNNDDPNKVYPPESIIDERIKKSSDGLREHQEYLVKWVGKQMPTWETASDVSDLQHLIDEYNQKKEKLKIFTNPEKNKRDENDPRYKRTHFCDSCAYAATKSNNLKRHKETQHPTIYKYDSNEKKDSEAKEAEKIDVQPKVIPIETPEEELMMPEKILGIRSTYVGAKEEVEYLVKWKGKKDTTWESEADINDHQELIDDFKVQKSNEIKARNALKKARQELHDINEELNQYMGGKF